MGRRRKKRIVKRKKPSTIATRYFQCPRCGSMTLTVDFEKTDNPRVKLAVARCGSCGLHCELEVPVVLERVDVYNRIVDLVYEGRMEECAPAAGEAGHGEGVGGAEEDYEEG